MNSRKFLRCIGVGEAREIAQNILEIPHRFGDPRHEKLFRILMSDGIRLARTGRINLFERMGDGRERLEALYEVTSLIATARSLEELARVQPRSAVMT